MSDTETWFVTSLARGLSVMQAFTKRREALSTSEVAEICGMSRAAARRFLLTLKELGFLRTVDNRYLLSVKALDLGYAFLSSTGVVDLVQPALEKLTASCGETSSMAILDGGEVVYVARTPTRRMISLRVGIGSRIPAYASSLGKAILAFLDDNDLTRLLETIELKKLTDQTITDRVLFRKELEAVRRDGYAITVSELEYGVVSIAVPILDGHNRVVAAVNISTQATLYNSDTLPSLFLKPLQTSKLEIESAIRALPNLSIELGS